MGKDLSGESTRVMNDQGLPQLPLDGSEELGGRKVKSAIEVVPCADKSNGQSMKKAAKRWSPTNGCRIAVTIEIPDTTKYAILPEVRDRLEEALRGRCPYVKSEGTALTLSFLATSQVPGEALEEAAALIPQLTNILGRDIDAAYSIWIVAAEGDLPVVGLGPFESGFPPCVGVGEAAELLGVSKQRVHQLTHAPGFPKPVMRLKATPIWLRDEVVHFQQTRSTRPGPVPISSR